MHMHGGGMMPGAPLSAAGVNFNNETQAMNFLAAVLDDTELQIICEAYARYFWYGAVAVIGIAGVANVARSTILKLRLRAAAAKQLLPAQPNNLFTRSFATVIALSREIAYPQITSTKPSSWFKTPPLGTLLLLTIYLSFLMALLFNDNDIPGAQHYTSLGVRASWLAIAQIPLLILLAGKNNLIGLVTGISYVRLNVLHRWVARAILLLATLHFGFQSYGWNKYGIMQLEWATDSCPPTGIAAYAILIWINLSTLAPFRNLSYEFFVVQHLVTFIGFIVAIMNHLPTTALYSRVYIYIPIGLYTIDRIIRTVRYIYNNSRPGKATMTQLAGGVTKVRVPMKHIKQWTPGAYVLLSIPRFGAGQSHPATIASIPTSHGGDLVFILKGHRGFTKRIMESANPSEESLLSLGKEKETAPQPAYFSLIDGPYNSRHADFAAFDTVALMAGSTGVTFILPILLDIAHRAKSRRLPVRRLELIWVVKNTSWTTWVSEELCSAFHDIRDAGIEIALTAFVTCDEKYTDSSWQPKLLTCKCEKSEGKCCCTVVDSDEDEISTEVTKSEKSIGGVGVAKSAISSSKKVNGIRKCLTFRSGRPHIYSLLWDLLDEAEGETGIAVCGPLALNTTVRNTVARISDQRAVHKGTGAQGIYVHVEGFSL